MITFKRCMLFLGFAFLLLFMVPIDLNKKNDDDSEFRLFLKKYNKTYNNVTEYQFRLGAFKASLNKINELNNLRKSNLSAWYGLTKYSDLFEDEFLDDHLMDDYAERQLLRNHVDTSSSEESKSREVRQISGLPLKIDWREKGVITPVNNQHTCGACWAFSVIETVEAMNAIKTKKLVKLSTQQAIDCAGYNNNGCDGGDMCTLLKWFIDKKVKIQTEEQYPLHLQTEKCKSNNTVDGVQIKKFACDSLINDENYILATLAKHGPVTTSINALSWQNYLGGIVQYHCNSQQKFLNHAVQIVGYDLESEIPHYIVRNSWGEDFGDKGYVYIAIGNNICGIANEVSALQVV
ncbi:PREDICTED: cathepsin O-like [Nicrophorus vespilloides]|uniref:Cathepsin O-like n=1 Tax=Nicrophorus vespilloides TaxID=110193 RepID=A0ABM1NA78_NICVS|nr:PREDICTED: cathepsin O-like [Nicrophorus vespilloides]